MSKDVLHTGQKSSSFLGLFFDMENFCSSWEYFNRQVTNKLLNIDMIAFHTGFKVRLSHRRKFFFGLVW